MQPAKPCQLCRPRRAQIHLRPARLLRPNCTQDALLPILGWSQDRKTPRWASYRAVASCPARHTEAIASPAVPDAQSLALWQPCSPRFDDCRIAQPGFNPCVHVGAAIANQLLTGPEESRPLAFRPPQSKHGPAHSKVSRCLILVEGVKLALIYTRHSSISFAAKSVPSRHKCEC